VAVPDGVVEPVERLEAMGALLSAIPTYTFISDSSPFVLMERL
jgi:hypothetical protein